MFRRSPTKSYMPKHIYPRPRTILRRRQVEARTGLSRSTIYDRMRDGTFPRQIALGAKSVGWLEADIEAWIETHVNRSRDTAN